jgi:hypothetical protein
VFTEHGTILRPDIAYACALVHVHDDRRQDRYRLIPRNINGEVEV